MTRHFRPCKAVSRTDIYFRRAENHASMNSKRATQRRAKRIFRHNDVAHLRELPWPPVIPQHPS